MTVIDQQQLADVIEVADIAVRSASQLRLSKRRNEIRDRQAIERAIRFLDDAIAGGRFMSTGQTAGLRTSLRPLNWAADVQFTKSPEAAPDYKDLVKFLNSVKSSLERSLAEEQMATGDELENAINFLSRLGKLLGTRADQETRRASGAIV